MQMCSLYSSFSALRLRSITRRSYRITESIFSSPGGVSWASNIIRFVPFSVVIMIYSAPRSVQSGQPMIESLVVQLSHVTEVVSSLNLSAESDCTSSFTGNDAVSRLRSV